jgi:hypothetical protein
MSKDNTQKEADQCCEKIKCCASDCCDGKQVAKFIRHIANFFDKKS